MHSGTWKTKTWHPLPIILDMIAISLPDMLSNLTTGNFDFSQEYCWFELSKNLNIWECYSNFCTSINFVEHYQEKIKAHSRNIYL